MFSVNYWQDPSLYHSCSFHPILTNHSISWKLMLDISSSWIWGYTWAPILWDCSHSNSNGRFDSSQRSSYVLSPGMTICLYLPSSWFIWWSCYGDPVWSNYCTSPIQRFPRFHWTTKLMFWDCEALPFRSFSLFCCWTDSNIWCCLNLVLDILVLWRIRSSRRVMTFEEYLVALSSQWLLELCSGHPQQIHNSYPSAP